MLHSFDMSDDDLSEQLSKTNTALAEWAARSASDSDQLIERFERMGYEVRGKSVDEITEVLKRSRRSHHRPEVRHFSTVTVQPAAAPNSVKTCIRTIFP